MSAMVKATPASWAAASRCSTVLVDPPIATSSVMALLNAWNVAMLRGRTEASSCSYQRLHSCTIRLPASSNSPWRRACVATTVPLPGSDRPRASVRQFMELAVNMPEQDPQVGQALRSTVSACSSVMAGSAASIHGIDQVQLAHHGFAVLGDDLASLHRPA